MKQKDFVTESSKILERYWQIIVIVVAALVFFFFIGYYIISHGKWDFYMDMKDAQVKEVTADADAEVKKVKRAYLTFDDGPSKNTMELLDVLDECDVKATFFVIGREEEYYDCYRAIVDRGHVLAIHSYTHDYSRIYSSKDNFANDIEELRKLLYDVTGVNPIYYRFPGGSSNTISKISMSELVDYIKEQGLIYFDWNALNNDAVSDGLTPQQLVDNIMKDAVKNDDVVILMHDLDGRHATIESIPLLVDTLRKAGYELLPIDERTPLIRHKVNAK